MNAHARGTLKDADRWRAGARAAQPQGICNRWRQTPTDRRPQQFPPDPGRRQAPSDGSLTPTADTYDPGLRHTWANSGKRIAARQIRDVAAQPRTVRECRLIRGLKVRPGPVDDGRPPRPGPRVLLRDRAGDPRTVDVQDHFLIEVERAEGPVRSRAPCVDHTHALRGVRSRPSWARRSSGARRARRGRWVRAARSAQQQR